MWDNSTDILLLVNLRWIDDGEVTRMIRSRNATRWQETIGPGEGGQGEK